MISNNKIVQMKLSAWLTSFFLLTISITSYLFIFGDDLEWSVFYFLNVISVLLCSSLLLYGNKQPSSLYQSVMAFYLIFLGFVPAIEYPLQIVYWGGESRVFESYPIATALSLVCLIFFSATHSISSNLSRRRSDNYEYWINANIFFLISMSFSASFVIYYYNGFSLISVFVRGGGETSSRIETSGMVWLIYQYFAYPIPSIALVLYFLFAKRSIGVTTILVLLFVMSNPVTGMARSQAASIYTAVLVSAFPSLLNLRYFISLGFIFCLFTIFPILDQFRNLARLDAPAKFSFDFIYVGHFDSFQGMARVMEYDMVTWGHQLLGSLLFFVPRSVWPNKPVGSGAFSANQSGLDFSNIGMNYFGEGYVNFGFFGAIGFAIILGVICGKLDTAFWKKGRALRPHIKVFYIYFIGQIFFILRGDLLSSFAYTIGLFASIYIVSTGLWIFTGRRNRCRTIISAYLRSHQ